MFGFLIASSLVAAISAVGNLLLVRHTSNQNKQFVKLTNQINSEKQTSLRTLETNTQAETDAINAVSGCIDEDVLFRYLKKHPKKITEQTIFKFLNSGQISQELADKLFKQITIDSFGHTWKVNKSIEYIDRRATFTINYYKPTLNLAHSKIHKICSVCGIEHFSYELIDKTHSVETSEYIAKKSSYWILDKSYDDNVMCPGKQFEPEKKKEKEDQADKPTQVKKPKKKV